MKYVSLRVLDQGARCYQVLLGRRCLLNYDAPLTWNDRKSHPTHLLQCSNPAYVVGGRAIEVPVKEGEDTAFGLKARRWRYSVFKNCILNYSDRHNTL